MKEKLLISALGEPLPSHAHQGTFSERFSPTVASRDPFSITPSPAQPQWLAVGPVSPSLVFLVGAAEFVLILRETRNHLSLQAQQETLIPHLTW